MAGGCGAGACEANGAGEVQGRWAWAAALAPLGLVVLEGFAAMGAGLSLGAEYPRERAGDLGGQAGVSAGRRRRGGIGVPRAGKHGPGQAAVQALDLVKPPDQAHAVTARAAGKFAGRRRV